MRFGLAVLLPAVALAQPPSFTQDQVRPALGNRPANLAPGMWVSIYGEHLGPAATCNGDARDGRFPTELCGVQVFLAGRTTGLQYASDKQINFQVPPGSVVEGEAELRVVYRSQEHSVTLRIGLEKAGLSLDAPAHAGGPVWLRIAEPFGSYDSVRYPVQIEPWNFGCQEVEVRRGGQLLPRIAVRNPMGQGGGGLPCGTIGIVGHPATHTGRLPLHLQYRFDQPGAYEVRYTKRDWRQQILLQSEWTKITILATATMSAAPTLPVDPADVLGDWLPNQLGVTTAAAMDTVVTCLYHSEPTVRWFAAAALSYWPEEEVRRRLTDVYLKRGPSDMIVDRVIGARPDLLARAAPYLRSPDRVLLRGAVIAAYRLLWKEQSGAMESALLDAEEHVIRTADEQTLSDYACALGAARDHRASRVLWELVSRRIATEQALIAITWRKNPDDLPRLSAAMEGPVRGEELSRQVASLPYHLRNSYGEAATPYLEMALRNSHSGWVRINCARELMQAGKRSGFAFAADGIRENRAYKGEMMQFVRDQFVEMKEADEKTMLEWLAKQ